MQDAEKNREWRHEYMTLFMRDQENIEKGIEKGKAEGRIEGRAEGIIEAGFEFGLTEKDILARLQNKLDISLQAAQDYLLRFGKQTI